MGINLSDVGIIPHEFHRGQTGPHMVRMREKTLLHVHLSNQSGLNKTIN